MYAITGITGQVGGVVARKLLAAGKPVRAVVRSAAKGVPWLQQGCELAIAEMADAEALSHAFDGAEGVFVLLPPHFDPSPDFAETRRNVAALYEALLQARPAKVVCLSTVGAQATQPNLLTQLQIMEQQLGTLPMPIAFLRAAWFMENAAWDVAAARDEGVLRSYLQPLARPIPMVATADVGKVAAELLLTSWVGQRIVELEAEQRISPLELAAALARLLGREVKAEAVPREQWETQFRAQGMQNPLPRMQMLDGFNAGWIDFDGGASRSRKGVTGLDTVLRQLIAQAV